MMFNADDFAEKPNPTTAARYDVFNAAYFSNPGRAMVRGLSQTPVGHLRRVHSRWWITCRS